MKIPVILFTLALLAGCSSPSGEANPETADGTGKNLPPPAAPVAAAVLSASATGVVEAVDHTARTITIAHGPVASLQWPAMTMTFKTSGLDLASVKLGDHVLFEFTSSGMDGTVTKIRRQ